MEASTQALGTQAIDMRGDRDRQMQNRSRTGQDRTGQDRTGQNRTRAAEQVRVRTAARNTQEAQETCRSAWRSGKVPAL